MNTWTTSSQEFPSVAMDADGNNVVAWMSNAQDGDAWGVYAQRCNAAGVAVGAEFRVNSYTTGTQYYPSVAMGPAGDFVVAWSGNGSGDDSGVFAQRYNASGIAQGGEFRVNSYTTGSQFRPTVAMNASGDFVVAWSSYGQITPYNSEVFAQRYDAAGVPQGSEFRVNTYTTSNQSDPAVAMSDAGNFVVTWESDIQDGSGYGIYAQRYTSAGTAQGAEFRVNVFAGSDQEDPSIAMDSAGDFVIAWGSLYQDGSGQGVYARRYNAAGAAQGSEFAVNTFTPNSQRCPSVAMDDAGNFAIAWESALQDGDKLAAYARRYNAAGVAQSGEFRANAYTTDWQSDATAAMDADGDFIVTWHSNSQDGSGYGVYAQRYTGFSVASAATIGDCVWLDDNGNGIQDAGEGGAADGIVELLNSDGVMASCATTGYDGEYELTLPAGTSVRLHFIAPPGMILTKTDQGSDDRLDSDADFTTGFIPLFSIATAGASDSSIDAGVVAPASVSGTVFYDRNGNGLKDGGEEGLDGFEVFVDLDEDGVRDADEWIAASGAVGGYTLNNLLSGASWIAVSDQDRWVEPTARLVNIPVGGTVSSINLPVRTGVSDSASTRQGGEFRVNSFTPDTQEHASSAMDANGNAVIVWTSWTQDGSSEGVYAQRYDASGAKRGGEFRVNTYTPKAQTMSSVAMNASGDFVVAWSSEGQDGSGFGAYAQRYNAEGIPQGTEFRVNSATASDQFANSVAIDPAGNFVVTFEGFGAGGWDIFARRYNSSGTSLGSEFRVNSLTGAANYNSSVAMDADGDCIIVWGTPGGGVYAQRYSAQGQPLGTQSPVNTAEANWVQSVAMDAAGEFVVAWYGREVGVYARRYNADGVPQGTSFLVDGDAIAELRGIGVASASGGAFVVTWQGGDDIYARAYNAAGVPQGSAFRVNTYTTNAQASPSLAMDENGDFVIAWDSSVQDSGTRGVYAQRYSLVARPAVSSGQFVWNTPPQRLEFTFDQDVSASLSVADLVLQNLTTGTTIPSNTIELSWNSATRTATFDFTSLINFGSLPDGNYMATLLSAGVSNSSGTTLAADYAVPFFILGGDANRDRIVDVTDLGILATNWQGTGRNFSQGDFNYDGVVDVTDLGILATNWQQSLSVPSAGLSVARSAKSLGVLADRGIRRPSRNSLVQDVLS